MTPSRNRAGKNIALALLGALAFGTSVRGAEFAGGTGEPNDPYQIATVEQLLSIQTDPGLRMAAKYYVLTASLDLGGTVRPGPVIDFFRGVLDGKGHTIRNLRIETGQGQGFFHMIDGEAEVKNLGLVNVYVVSTVSPGGLASTNLGYVHNCYTTGTVISGGGMTGGLVGHNAGMITDCYSTATVTGETVTGGLVGENTGVVFSCHSTGDVTGDSETGGLVGFNMGEITASYAAGTVSGGFTGVGGLAGYNSGRISSSYASATVTGVLRQVGGLVGENGGTISCCYATGKVTGEDDVGGLTGVNGGRIETSYAAVLVDCYGWYAGGLVGRRDADIPVRVVKDCYFLAQWEGGGPDNGYGTSLTEAEMRQQASFGGWDFWGPTAAWTWNLWYMPEDGYPLLAWQVLRWVPDVSGLTIEEAKMALAAAGFTAGDVTYDFDRALAAGCVIHADPYLLAPDGAAIGLIVSSGAAYDWTQNPGAGTADQPYEVQTAGQLESLIDHPELWDKHFVLSADLDMIGRRYEVALIAPDVDDWVGFQGTPFRGVFHGQGRTIRNLTIAGVRGTHHEYVGLFGMVAPEGRIEDLHLRDARISGGSGSQSFVGALAGYNAGTIVDCSATGALNGGKGDGLVGFNAGTLSNSEAQMDRIQIIL
jgi:hypothetical protein